MTPTVAPKRHYAHGYEIDPVAEAELKRWAFADDPAEAEPSPPPPVSVIETFYAEPMDYKRDRIERLCRDEERLCEPPAERGSW